MLNQLNFLYRDTNFSVPKSKNFKKRDFKENSSRNQFTRFIVKNLEKVLPKSYLENFDLIENKVKKLNWPKNPKVIMTSYSHYFDEIFKIYAALKIEKKTKLVFLQHGHQGHHQMCGSYFEKKICDNYISWGNKSNEKKNIPLFITTNIGKTIKKKIKMVSYLK